MKLKKIFSTEDSYKSIALSFIYFMLLTITSICIFVPFLPIMPSDGLDGSWTLGINQAVADSLAFGRNIIFTFGPYASIYTRAYHPLTDGLMVWGGLFLGISFAVVAFLNYRESKWYVQLMLLIILASVMYSPDALLFYYPLLVGVYCFRFITKEITYIRSPLSQNIIIFFIFTPFGLLPLIKGTTIVICIAIEVFILLMFALRHEWKKIIIVILSPISSLFLFSLIAGQSLVSLPFYFWNIFPIMSGYTEAMSTEGNRYEILIYIVSSFFLLWVSFSRSSSRSLSSRIILTLMFFSVLFLAMKAGFVRHDTHALNPGTTILLVGLLICSINQGNRAIFALLISFSCWLYIDSMYMKTNSQTFLGNIYNTYKYAWSGIELRADNGRLVENYKEALGKIHLKTPLPSLEGSTDIYSYDLSDLISSGNKWNPRPIFQSYSVYTPSLIEKNRSHLYGSAAPDNIFFKIQALDQRLPPMEDGASWPIFLSSYLPTKVVNQDTLILKKQRGVPENIIETKLSGGKYKIGEDVFVPKFSDPIYVKVNLNPSFLGRLVGVVFKTSPLQMNINLENGQTRKYRVVSGMLKTGLILSPLVENINEFLLVYDNSDFNDGKKVTSFSIAPQEESWLWDKEYEVEFSSLRFPSRAGLEGDLFDLEKPIAQNNNFRMTVADRCDGYIDYVNGMAPAPLEFNASKRLSINGWLALSIEKGLLPESVKVVLMGQNGQIYLIQTKKVPRPDVGRYHKNNQLDYSGYSVNADTSMLHGVYKLGLAVESGGNLKICQRFDIAVKFTAPK